MSVGLQLRTMCPPHADGCKACAVIGARLSHSENCDDTVAKCSNMTECGTCYTITSAEMNTSKWNVRRSSRQVVKNGVISWSAACTQALGRTRTMTSSSAK